MALAFGVVLFDMIVHRRSVALPPLIIVGACGLAISGLVAALSPPSDTLTSNPLIQQAAALSSVAVKGRNNLISLVKFEAAILLLPLLVGVVATTRERAIRVADAWAIGAIISAGVATTDMIGITHVSESLLGLPLGAGRQSGLTLQPNHLALGAALVLPWVVIWLTRSRPWRIAGVVGITLLALGIYASRSRGAEALAPFALLFGFIMAPQLRMRLTAFAPLVGLLCILALVASTGSLKSLLYDARLTSNASGVAASNYQRAEVRSYSLRAFEARPLTGVGYTVIDDAHDIYVQLLAAGGVIGLASFAVIMAGAFGLVMRLWRSPERLSAAALGAALVVWGLDGIVENQITDRYLYVPIAVLVALVALQPRRRLHVSERFKPPPVEYEQRRQPSGYPGPPSSKPGPRFGYPAAGIGRREARDPHRVSRNKRLHAGFTRIGQSRTSVSIASSFGLQGMLVITGVIGARILGVDNRGNLALLWILAAIPAQLIMLGVPLALTYYIALAPRTARPLLGSLRWAMAIQVIVLVGVHVILILAFFGSRHGDVRTAALISLLATPGILLTQYGLAVLQGEQRIRAFSFYRVLSTLAYSSFLVPAFILGTHSLALVAACWVASLIVTGVGAATHALRRLPPAIPLAPGALPTFRTVVSFGLRGLLGSAAPLEVFNLDQAIVGIFVSARGLGLYVIGTALTNLPQGIGQAIGFVAYPEIAARGARGVSTATIRFVVLTIALTGAAVALIELVLGPLVPLVYGADFAPAVPVARILLLSAVFMGARRVLGDCVRGAGYPVPATFAEIVSIAALLGFAGLLVGRGLIGVAIALTAASAAGFFVLLITVLLLSRRQRTPAPADTTAVVTT
jgi:O-antigen/teichoic acid export membrane protein